MKKVLLLGLLFLLTGCATEVGIYSPRPVIYVEPAPMIIYPHYFGPYYGYPHRWIIVPRH